MAITRTSRIWRTISLMFIIVLSLLGWVYPVAGVVVYDANFDREPVGPLSTQPNTDPLPLNLPSNIIRDAGCCVDVVASAGNLSSNPVLLDSVTGGLASATFRNPSKLTSGQCQISWDSLVLDIPVNTIPYQNNVCIVAHTSDVWGLKYNIVGDFLIQDATGHHNVGNFIVGLSDHFDLYLDLDDGTYILDINGSTVISGLLIGSGEFDLTYFRSNGRSWPEDLALFAFDNLRVISESDTLLPAYAKYSGGSGEPNDPYQIATAEDLMLLGETPEDYDKHFILTTDIDLDPNLPGRKVFDKAVIAPDIDPERYDFQGTSFSGVFDGNGHIISNLTIEGKSVLGLFGYFQGEISNLGLEAVDVKGTDDDVGSLVSVNFGNIIICYSTGTVTGHQGVGGLAGVNFWNSSLSRCYSTCVTRGISIVGGLIGTNWGSTYTSYSTGNVSGNRRVGGLVGDNIGLIGNSYSSGSVYGNSSIGGLAGSNSNSPGWGIGYITASYSNSEVRGENSVGGLVGENWADTAATSSFWDMETSVQTTSAGGTGKTTSEMQTTSTFLEANWDFVSETINGPNDIWKMWDGYDYPRLTWEPGPHTPLVFVDINDPGFYGQMSKYEVTNDQYRDFLNAALASDDITIDGNDVLGESGTNSGEDYIGERYYRCDGSGYTGYGATNGGASRIHYNEGAFSVDEGFDNHPVTYVSWYGAMAFCNYYGYYLPTEEQWQAVADYDGTYIYGCGQTIDPSIANYRNSEHPDGTTPVGSFGTYGYGMSDMAGNVWEWTSSSLDSNRIFRGGSLGSIDSDCDVSIRGDGIPHASYWDIGFRVCR